MSKKLPRVMLKFVGITDKPDNDPRGTTATRFRQAEGCLVAIFGPTSPELAGSSSYVWQLNDSARLGLETDDLGKHLRLTFRNLAPMGGDTARILELVELLESIDVPAEIGATDESGGHVVKLKWGGPLIEIVTRPLRRAP